MNNLKKRKINVLLTCAGGASLPFLIKLLKRKGFRVFTADMNPKAVGLFLADKGFVIPPGRSSDFLPKLKALCQKEKVDVLVPLADEELLKACKLEKDGITVILPRAEFIKMCLDKYIQMKKLKQTGILVPKTSLASESFKKMNFPLVIKPRVGRGSRGLRVIKSKRELQETLKDISNDLGNFLVQEYVDGTEYTVSVVVWRDGKVQAVVPKEIISKKGITKLAVTRRNLKINTVCRNIQKTFKANGPFNVQLKINKEDGRPYIFEVNPRFSTTITLTIKAGVDELGEIIKQAVFGAKKKNFDNWKEGVVLLRQSFDQFIDEKDFKKQLESIQNA